MRRILNRLLILAIAVSSVVSCGLLQQEAPVPVKSVPPNQNAATANQQLKKLKRSDVRVNIDSSLLAAEMQNQLQLLADKSDHFIFENTTVSFEQQNIKLTMQVIAGDPEQGQQRLEALGKISLEVSGDHIEWFPSFHKINVLPDEPDLNETVNGVATTPGMQRLLSDLNSEMSRNLNDSNFNQISLHTIPLGEVTAGTRLNTFNNAIATQSAALNGVFFVTGSAILIDSDFTSILLNLSFVPDLAVCPADIQVSRAVFSRTTEAREPVDIANNLDDAEDMRVFYSEISGATRPMTIIHYWFADGRPLAVEELPIGPSERWRTWSTRSDTGEVSAHWRVLVVEKQSGCILHSQSIRSKPPDATLDDGGQPSDQPIDDFAVYAAAFNQKAKDFPVPSNSRAQLSIDIRRNYLGQVIQSAIADLQMEASFSPTDLPSTNHHADLLPFDAEQIACEEQKCANPLVCTANIAHCKRLRDTRECSSCLFHNPLNNRCLQMAEDPKCVAAKNRQNAHIQQDQQACFNAAENSRSDCQQLSQQIAQSCEIENRVEQSACEASKTEITSLKPGSVLARVTADSSVSGHLSTLFSNFKVSADIGQIQQNVTLKSDLSIIGQLGFEPENTDWLLSNCINAWSGPFNNHAISATPLNSMLSPLTSSDAEFTANWSGIVLPLKMNSSPLESTFVSNPQLLAGCSIGLTVNKVEQAVVGKDADFFGGWLNLVVQPLPTRLRLNDASINLAGQSYQGTAHIGSKFVSYQLKRN